MRSGQGTTETKWQPGYRLFTGDSVLSDPQGSLRSGHDSTVPPFLCHSRWRMATPQREIVRKDGCCSDSFHCDGENECFQPANVWLSGEPRVRCGGFAACSAGRGENSEAGNGRGVRGRRGERLVHGEVTERRPSPGHLSLKQEILVRGQPIPPLRPSRRLIGRGSRGAGLGLGQLVSQGKGI